MQDLLWVFLPDQAFALVLVLAGVAFMLGFRRFAGGLVVTVLAIALLGPFVESAFSQLPAWISLIVLLLFALAILRSLMAGVLGERATGHVIGELAISVIKGLLRLLLLPFRFLWWVVEGLGRRPYREKHDEW